MAITEPFHLSTTCTSANTIYWYDYNNCSFICRTKESPEELFRKWWAKRESSLAAVLKLAREWKPIARVIHLAKKRFQRRSDPRWGASVWKAKT